MTRDERVLVISSGAEAAVLVYGTLVAFLTPSAGHEHNVLVAVVLLSVAGPLAWHAASVAFDVTRPLDPLMLRVIIPNGALLVLCLSGSLGSTLGSGDLLPALVAVVALVMIVAAIRLAQGRSSRDTQPVRS